MAHVRAAVELEMRCTVPTIAPAPPDARLLQSLNLCLLHMFRHRRGLRFLEPAVLALLRERRTHGYELITQLPQLLGTDRVDVGNVYRALRALEERGLVTSEWRDDLPGPAKRAYEITEDGRRALARWSEWLREARERIDTLLTTIEGR